MPRLWSQTIEAHRREVRDAILETTAAQIAERGLRAVTMSDIAERTGIGRATLYKYFPDVDAILLAWHDRHVTAHLAHLAAVRDEAAQPGERLEAVLQAWANIAYEMSSDQHGPGVTALLHTSEHIADAQQQLHNLIRDVLADAAQDGYVRDDIPADELANYCRNALNAAASLPSEAAVRRLVALALAALLPQRHTVQPTTSSRPHAQSGRTVPDQPD